MLTRQPVQRLLHLAGDFLVARSQHGGIMCLRAPIMRPVERRTEVHGDLGWQL
jgi:hypothetical protein